MHEFKWRLSFSFSNNRDKKERDAYDRLFLCQTSRVLVGRPFDGARDLVCFHEKLDTNMQYLRHPTSRSPLYRLRRLQRKGQRPRVGASAELGRGPPNHGGDVVRLGRSGFTVR